MSGDRSTEGCQRTSVRANAPSGRMRCLGWVRLVTTPKAVNWGGQEGRGDRRCAALARPARACAAHQAAVERTVEQPKVAHACTCVRGACVPACHRRAHVGVSASSRTKRERACLGAAGDAICRAVHSPPFCCNTRLQAAWDSDGMGWPWLALPPRVAETLTCTFLGGVTARLPTHDGLARCKICLCVRVPVHLQARPSDRPPAHTRARAIELGIHAHLRRPQPHRTTLHPAPSRRWLWRRPLRRLRAVIGNCRRARPAIIRRPAGAHGVITARKVDVVDGRCSVCQR
jgi:hypothetical protein